MRLRFDRFTWIVVVVVALLVVAAVVTVNLTGGGPETPLTYRDDDSPATPVYNALIAVQQGDLARARAQFSQSALDEYEKQGYDPIANAASNYLNDQSGRRTRIIETSEPLDGEAAVTIAEDNYSGGSLFGQSTWTNQRIIRVVREDGTWKIAENSLFY